MRRCLALLLIAVSLGCAKSAPPEPTAIPDIPPGRASQQTASDAPGKRQSHLPAPPK